MDLPGIEMLIGGLGFPIASCVGLFAYILKKDAKMDETIEKFREALERNTLAINSLLNKEE